MWFITRADPALRLRVPGRARGIVFVRAEYRTDDPAEIAVLRADPRVIEVVEKRARADMVRPWAVNLETGILHDLSREVGRCHIPGEVRAAGETAKGQPDGWRLYRRRSDAVRWNRDVTPCVWCVRKEV